MLQTYNLGDMMIKPANTIGTSFNHVCHTEILQHSVIVASSVRV